ncbi:MAG: biosynthetic-type acetolactate synthase large subunit [Anaerolineae bacterium]|nr:biosynthetic-type acetolactate synthase large subunit [Anaerolineae bacterium]
MKLKGSEIILECLMREGVDVMFGITGGAILPTFDAMTRYPQIKHIHTRHEQGAAHMADGYARATGKVGVAVATSGPGATNLVTGLATAMMDSSPVVAITGQVGTATIGSDAFQETDVTGVTLPVTKHNYLVYDIDELAYTIKEAFHIARTGRPGPVLVDVPKDVQNTEIEFVYPEEGITLPGYQPATTATCGEIEMALRLIRKAQRPVILAGHGILMAGAMREVVEFAERTQTPITWTLLGKGAVPESHYLNLGMMGMHGEAYCNTAIQSADLLLAFGMRFDDRVTGNLATYAPEAKKIHIDIDASEIHKNVHADLGIVGDLKMVLNQLLPELEPMQHADWMEQIDEWRDDTTKRDIINQKTSRFVAAQAIYDIWRFTGGEDGGETIFVSDVGQHQMWVAQYCRLEKPHTHITSGGLGTMGFGMPAAIGAKLGRPDAEIWAVVGDGGFQMTMAELGTLAQYNVPVKVAIINNHFLGMVRQWQELFYDSRFQATPLVNPDFVKIAEAYNITARRVEQRSAVNDAIQWARAVDGPVVLDFDVEEHDIVYPMVPSGADLHDMIRRPMPEGRKQS